MVKPWQKLSSKPIGNFRVFNIRSDVKVNPRTGREHDFYVIESVNWVNVIALTRDNQVVMIDQYRHGSNTVELEVPGGMMDAEDISPLEAGIRELREETGYEGKGAEVIGKIYANPAIMTNTCYTVLVRDCELKHATSLDSGEDLATRLVPLSDVPKYVANGNIGHCLVVVAFYHLDLWLKRQAQATDPQQMIV